MQHTDRTTPALVRLDFQRPIKINPDRLLDDPVGLKRGIALAKHYAGRGAVTFMRGVASLMRRKRHEEGP